MALSTIKAAWDQSRYREKIIAFLRDRIFGGAARQIEERAVEKRRFHNLKISDVEESKAISDFEIEVKIKLERENVIEPRPTDQELLEDFIKKLTK